MLKSRQEELVVHHLRTVGTITGREAEALYRIQDLPKRISQLRAEGYAIDRVLRKDEEGRRYARYAFPCNAEMLNAGR